MTNLAVFGFEGQSIRILTIDGEFWFVAKDLAQVLDYSEANRMLQLVDERDKQTINPQKLDSPDLVESFGSNTFRISQDLNS